MAVRQVMMEDVEKRVAQLQKDAELDSERESRKRLANLLTAWMEFYGAEGMETETILAARAALGGSA
jgi:CRP-like cAMP-binding protein